MYVKATELLYLFLSQHEAEMFGHIGNHEVQAEVPFRFK